MEICGNASKGSSNMLGEWFGDELFLKFNIERWIKVKDRRYEGISTGEGEEAVWRLDMLSYSQMARSH